MDIKQLNDQLNNFFKVTLPTFFKNLPQKIKEFPAKFKQMSLGEQIAYICIFLGVILIVVSLFLF
ncbi:MAG: hypothetical protein ABIA37_00555 [Candidatus Woesearchaeota archaeon]